MVDEHGEDFAMDPEGHDALAYAHMAVTEDTVSYLMEVCEYALISDESFEIEYDNPAAPSHVVRRVPYGNVSRMRNLLCWAVILLILPVAMAATLGPDNFTSALFTVVRMLAGAFFLLGRWSRATETTTLFVQFSEAGTQTGDTTISRRLRYEIELWKMRALEAQNSAMESRKTLDLAIANMNDSGELMHRAGHILRRCLKEMDEHHLEGPLHSGIHIARHGRNNPSRDETEWTSMIHVLCAALVCCFLIGFQSPEVLR